MKKKHNKKRNTAFLFEVLVREMTKTFVSGDSNRSKKIKTIFKDSFGAGKTLSEELDCYNALREKSGLDRYTAEKLIFETKSKHGSLDKDEIFLEQSKLIKRINVDLGADVYKNFVPNYKNYATISQIFGDKTPVKNRVLLESEILSTLTSTEEDSKEMKPVDSLVVKKFIENFNTKYFSLLESQKKLLEKYIVSFSNNGVDFKVYLAEELSRILEEVKQSLVAEEVKNDKVMVENTKRTISLIEDFDVSNVGPKELSKILKLQSLSEEYKNNDD